MSTPDETERAPASGWAWCRDEACIEAVFQKMSEHHKRYYGRAHQHVVSDPRTRPAPLPPRGTEG
jgi:hypothetical protein